MVTIEGYSNSLGGALQRMVNSEGVGSLFQRYGDLLRLKKHMARAS